VAEFERRATKIRGTPVGRFVKLGDIVLPVPLERRDKYWVVVVWDEMYMPCIVFGLVGYGAGS